MLLSRAMRSSIDGCVENKDTLCDELIFAMAKESFTWGADTACWRRWSAEAMAAGDVMRRPCRRRR